MLSGLGKGAILLADFSDEDEARDWGEESLEELLIGVLYPILMPWARLGVLIGVLNPLGPFLGAILSGDQAPV